MTSTKKETAKGASSATARRARAVPTTLQVSRISLLEQKLEEVAALALENGVPPRAVDAYIRQCYRRDAPQRCKEMNLRPNRSSCAIITGHTRKYMAEKEDFSLWQLAIEYHRLERVIDGWLATYPGVFELENRGEKDSFQALTKQYAGDVPVHALEEVGMRLGILEAPRYSTGKVRLLVTDLGHAVFGGKGTSNEANQQQ